MNRIESLKVSPRKSSARRPSDCPGTRPLALPELDEAKIAELSRVHKALSDQTRLRILAYLQAGELCVCELLEALKMPQSTVSHHLLLLQNAGLITSRKQGRWVLYSTNANTFEEHAVHLQGVCVK